MLQMSHPKHKQGVFPVFILCLAAVTIANKHSGNYTCSTKDDVSITSWQPDTNDNTSDDTKENSTTDKEGFLRIDPDIRSNETGEITSEGTTGSSTESTTAPMTSDELLAEENRTLSRLRHRLQRFKSAVTASSPGSGLPLGFDPYVGQFVPCTRDERECLRFGTLFDPQRGRCLLSAAEWCHAVPPHRRADLADGRAPLVATCPPGCASPSSPNASLSSSWPAGSAGSAQCAAATWSRRAFTCSCPGELAAPRPLTVGGFTCLCDKGEKAVAQPSKGRRCRVPYLHFPWTAGSPLDPRRQLALLRSPLPLRCDQRQQLCALNHTVWASESLGCQPLLQRRSSACPEGQWLALDAGAALEGALRARCVRRDGGCEAEAKGKGSWRRALFDGRCHRLRALKLLGPSPPKPTLFGEFFAPHVPLQLWLRARHNDSEEACELRHAAPEQAPPTTPEQAPQLNATAAALKYRRFHASDAFIGAPIACTYEQKLCFRYNTLFNPSSGHCLPIRGYSNAPPQVDAHELLHGSGQLVAKDSLEPDPCVGYRMAYDGRCYPKALVHAVLCGCTEEPTPHFLGGVECRCGAATPAVRVSQPPGDGHCRIPDLRFPDHERYFLFAGSPPADKFFPVCPRAQHNCFREGKVWFSDPDGCYTLNERGPCPPDHTLVITNWGASAECVRACPSGQERMAFDGQCHERREIQVLLPPDATISALNVQGQRLVVPGGYEMGVSLYVEGDRCVVEYILSIPMLEPWAQFAAPPCGAGDGNACLLYEVQSRPPTVDDFEDY